MTREEVENTIVEVIHKVLERKPKIPFEMPWREFLKTTPAEETLILVELEEALAVTLDDKEFGVENLKDLVTTILTQWGSEEA